jgi:hypothetical protein
MTNTIINVNTGTLAGDTFYGDFKTTIKGKRESVMVSNHIKDLNKEFEFRIANKCQAGFVNIHDTKGTAEGVIRGYQKNSLVNIQLKNEFGHWVNVYTTFPVMCDMDIWTKFGAKTWADKAFVQN